MGQHVTSRPPKLRSDLDLHRQTTDSGPVLVIKDPRNGQFFRLREAEWFIAEQFDGATSLEAVQKRAEDKFGAALAPEELAAFVKALDQNGLLESETGSGTGKTTAQRRVGGNILCFRIRLFDPDRLLNFLNRHCRFLFTRVFFWLSAGAILTAMGVSVFGWSEIVQDASRLYQLSTVPLLLTIVFLVIGAHEFAHGLTCKYFGGEVHEMGFLLLCLQPALYCNVSDAWLFPEKSKRLLVGFAGPYFELFIWALATLTWRLTDSDALINHASLVVMATSGIKTLFNFNPLIKLDGYYLLSDYLGLPNLYQKSFQYFGNLLKRLGGRKQRMPEITRREKWIYLAYGPTAFVFSVALLAYVAWIVGQNLIVQNQRVAFLAFTGMIGLRFRNRFSSLFGGNGGNSDSPPAPKRKLGFFFRLVLKLAVLAAVVTVLFLGRTELRVAGPVNVLPIHNADVRTEIEGIIEQIYVDEGKRVVKGDLVARLSDRDQKAELQKVEAEIQQVQAKLEMLKAGPTRQEIEVARRAVATAQDRVEFAQAKLTRDKALFEQQLLAPSDFDSSRQLESAAKNELAEAKSKLQVLLEGTRPEEIQASRAELAKLDAQQRYCKEQLELVNVLSPASGVVTTPTRQLAELAGQLIQKGDVIAKVHELKTVTVETAISEKEIADVKLGQTVAVKLRAHPAQIFLGKVTAIAVTAYGAGSITKTSVEAIPPPSAQVSKPILVTTEIDNEEELLKPGMTGMAKIYCGERRMIDLVTRRLSRTFRVEFWSWW